MGDSLAAVLDIGKTNARLTLIDTASGERVWSAQRPSIAVKGAHPWRELDVAGIEAWLLEALMAAPERERIAAVVPVAHGAAAVLLDADGGVLTAPDYEDPCFDETRAAYEAERDAYADTCSPPLPLGLNLGAQLFHLETRHPELFARVARIVTYPQYWAWRLSGVLAGERTSLGCHTDLWLPAAGEFSGLARRRGWDRRLPPLRWADETLGALRPELARRLGMDPRCRILCGIHDSNASYFVHLQALGKARPFAVVSSGTWTIAMAAGCDIRHLIREKDMLANVDAHGHPVATGRFMGGREYAQVAGDEGLAAVPTAAALEAVMRAGTFALPSFVPDCGPVRHEGRITGPAPQDGTGKAALATVYVALMTDLVLDLLQARGTVLVDGPLGRNPLFAPLLAALRPADSVIVPTRASDTTQGGFLLAAPEQALAVDNAAAVHGIALPGLADYKVRWRALVGE